MKTTVNSCEFIDAFRRYDRYDQFGYDALQSLFDYLEQLEEDTGEEIELDVIALCCDYSVSYVDTIAQDYNIDVSGKKRYIAGWNMPGYLPDSDPAEFDDEDDAIEYIKEAAKDDIPDEGDDEDNQHQEDEDDIDTWATDEKGEFGATVRGFHYWISQDGQFPMPYDEKRNAVIEYLNDNTTIVDDDVNGQILYCSAF